MTYTEKKAKARRLAIEWQQIVSNTAQDYEFFVRWAELFQKIAKKYGLVREFRENGII